PTNGETNPPPATGRIPRKADALPAILSCRCIPNEKHVVFTIPKLETTRKSDKSKTNNGKLNKTEINNSTPPKKEVVTPHFNKCVSYILNANLPVSCAAIIIPNPFTAKIMEYVNGVT